MTTTSRLVERLEDNIGKVMVGKREQIRTALIGLLCRGHLLIEDVPGTGKTMLARSIARSLDCGYSRIQFTPDTLPGDLTGVSVYDRKKESFVFHPGPILAQIVLADEINRATPKTQSALLEAMDERQVSVDGSTYPLREPFLVVATQNPVEYIGTFPLPEAQLDRFMLRIRLGYPDIGEEMEILDRQRLFHPIDELSPVACGEDVLAAQEEIRSIHVSPPVKEYIVRLVERTRRMPEIELGASPRASLALYRAAQAEAAIDGRDWVEPDDVKRHVPSALGHRIVPGPEADVRGVSVQSLLSRLVEETAVPEGASRM